jgi:type I restriction enzyme S subunit
MREKRVKTAIGEVAKVLPGYAFDSDDFDENAGMPLIRIRDLANGLETATRFKGQFDERFVVSRGDFLIGMDGEFRCYEWRGDKALLNQRVCRVQDFDSSRIVPRFVFFLLDEHLIRIERNTAFTTVKHISTKQIEAITFDCPPLRVQQRIVDLMSAVDEYIAALECQADAARTARNAVLHELLTASGDDWVETTVGSVCVVKGGKRLPKGTPWSQSPTPHPYIRATDFRDGRIDTTNLVYVPDDVWPTVSRYVVEANDVLITIAGTIGAVALVPATHVGANLTENAALMRPVDSSIDCRFLHVWLLSENAQRQITELTIGTTQQKLGLFRIESLKLTLPTLGEQKRIVAIVSSMDDLIHATESAIVESKNLRSGLLSNLLSGEHGIPASYDRLLGAA